MVKKKKKYSNDKMPKVLKIGDYQIGKSILAKDMKYQSLPPGKRLSKAGNIYYEYRKNRSDIKGKKV